jgi:hypothetical protein
MARLVHDDDSLRLGMVPNHDLLHAIAQALLVPLRKRKKFLECPWRNPRPLRHRLDTLPRQVAQLALHILLEMILGIRVDEAVGKRAHIPGQRRAQRLNL